MPAPLTEKFEVRNRWTGDVQFTAEITVTPDMLPGVKLGLAVKWARKNGADLRDTNLRGSNLRYCNLSGSDLRDCNLSGSDLSGSNLRGSDLRDCNLSGAPVIPNIHQAVYAAASQPDGLNMGDWHTCETTHCRGGWVVFLAGEEGRALESKIGTRAAATLIYLASDPKIDKFPDFYCGNTEALADMKRLAEKEAA